MSEPLKTSDWVFAWVGALGCWVLTFAIPALSLERGPDGSMRLPLGQIPVALLFGGLALALTFSLLSELDERRKKPDARPAAPTPSAPSLGAILATGEIEPGEITLDHIKAVVQTMEAKNPPPPPPAPQPKPKSALELQLSTPKKRQKGGESKYAFETMLHLARQRPGTTPEEALSLARHWMRNGEAAPFHAKREPLGGGFFLERDENALEWRVWQGDDFLVSIIDLAQCGDPEAAAASAIVLARP